MDIGALQTELREFVAEREWEQFHSPKNLTMALSVEASELMEHFQWLTEEQSRALSPETHQEAAFEMADVFLYLVRLADVLEVNLETVVQEKLALNVAKYPVHLSKGNAVKYNRRVAVTETP